jgi:phosphoadenosine phosphosulfate reductase
VIAISHECRPAAATAASPTLLAELDRINQQLESKPPIEILRWAVTRFGAKLTMATAFGPEGVTLIYMLSIVGPQTHVFNLDTGYQFPETLELRDRIADRYGIEVEMVRPDQPVADFEGAHGPLYKTDPDRCCFERKIRVLRNAIVGKEAWITAIRRDQSPERASAKCVSWDHKFGLVKINPLVNCSKATIWKMIDDDDIPYNPLHDQGYSSIGCWPCTRAVHPGEDERAGRWSGFAKSECGLHTNA